MFGVVFSSLWTVAKTVLMSVVSNVGIPFVRSMVTPDSVYQYVNALLGQHTTARSHETTSLRRERDRDPDHGVNRLSRPNFRRRPHRVARHRISIINPTIYITVPEP